MTDGVLEIIINRSSVIHSKGIDKANEPTIGDNLGVLYNRTMGQMRIKRIYLIRRMNVLLFLSKKKEETFFCALNNTNTIFVQNTSIDTNKSSYMYIHAFGFLSSQSFIRCRFCYTRQSCKIYCKMIPVLCHLLSIICESNNKYKHIFMKNDFNLVSDHINNNRNGNQL